jgi:hypothetical protein
MRTGAERRGVARVLRSRWVAGPCVAALLAGSTQLEIGGHSAGAYIGGLFVSPADARKAHRRGGHPFGAQQRRDPDDPRLPLFAPSRRPPAFKPSQGSPAFVAFEPRRRPFARSERRTPSFPRAEGGKPAGAFAAWVPVRQASRSNREVRRSTDEVRLFAHRPAAAGGWDVLVHRTSAPVAMDRPARQPAFAPPPPAPTPPAASHAALPPDAKARTTIHRLFEKLAARRQKHRDESTARRDAPARTAEAPSGTTGRERAEAARRGARPAVRRLGGRPAVPELLPPVGSFRPNEVLAVNLSTDGLARVRDSSYEVVEHIMLPEIGLTLTRLRPPGAFNAITGRERLFELLPEDGFTLNRVYAPYRPGAGRPAAASAAIPATGGAGCPAERCFGSALISWRRHLSACAGDIRIGIVDTGFDRSHPAFARVRYQYKEFLPEGSARASSEHGTGVLSLLAGDADSGTPGLIPEASYAVANAFFAGPGGEPQSDTAQMLRALAWLKRSGVAVVNLSFAGPPDELLHHAVQELTGAGAVVVAAAGNDGPFAPPSYPAAYPEVIAVTAVDRKLAPYRYAGRGAHIDIAAPGVDVWTAMPGGRAGAQTGTSFAVPYVTAVVAVSLPEALSAAGDPLAAKRRALALIGGNIRSLGAEARDPTFGAGLVQAPAACAVPPATVMAANAAPAAQAWAGTVHKAADESAPAEPMVVGSWMSTVYPASGDGLRR